ncbi:ISL3 family transposase [Cytobacillus firmus]|uniref:ISL3 family transposase n=1 Tax=Cytobacillus firmus TaxID=1399 RepID=UPI0036A841DC
MLVSSPSSNLIPLHLIEEEDHYLMILKSSSSSCVCPSCGIRSNRIHSHYTRFIQDLPINEKVVYLQVQVRKFFCTNIHCESTIFTERFSWVEPYQRQTKRLHKVLTGLALSNNCLAAARMANLLHVAISHDSLLRLIHQVEIPVYSQPCRIGLDDFAFKKRNRYGTLIVDLESKKTIDVLDSRNTTTVQSWLKKHPSIQLVSRDGSRTYASAITEALPSSTQVTDRWHLLKGLFDALKQALIDYLPSKWTEKKRVLSLSKSEKVISPRKSDQLREKHTDQKWERILKVQQLYQQGKAVAAIARQLNMSRGTVYRDLGQTKRPDLRRSSILDPFLPTVQSMISEGYTIDSIEQKIRKDGYSGSRSTLNAMAARVRRENSDIYTSQTVLRSKLLSNLWKEDDFKTVIHDVPDSFLETFPHLEIIYEAVHTFQSLVRNQDYQRLEAWISQYEKVTIPSIQAFINGIKSDLEAVKNALYYPWNNGILEGQINRLKTIKRMMYGRAGYELLKRRMLSSLEELF